eukprot:4912986-Amphidinium_carterae.2
MGFNRLKSDVCISGNVKTNVYLIESWRMWMTCWCGQSSHSEAICGAIQVESPWGSWASHLIELLYNLRGACINVTRIPKSTNQGYTAQ